MDLTSKHIFNRERFPRFLSGRPDRLDPGVETTLRVVSGTGRVGFDEVRHVGDWKSGQRKKGRVEYDEGRISWRFVI